MSTGIGCTKLVIPNTANMLNTLLPKRFPIEMLFCPLKTAIKEVASSGNEVPKATTVAPIINSETPIEYAISTAFDISSSEPK